MITAAAATLVEGDMETKVGVPAGMGRRRLGSCSGDYSAIRPCNDAYKEGGCYWDPTEGAGACKTNIDGDCAGYSSQVPCDKAGECYWKMEEGRGLVQDHQPGCWGRPRVWVWAIIKDEQQLCLTPCPHALMGCLAPREERDVTVSPERGGGWARTALVPRGLHMPCPPAVGLISIAN